jgi:hypothetical protein
MRPERRIHETKQRAGELLAKQLKFVIRQRAGEVAELVRKHISSWTRPSVLVCGTATLGENTVDRVKRRCGTLSCRLRTHHVGLRAPHRLY